MRGVRANLDAAGGGTYLIFPLVKLILGPPLPDNYCTVPKFKTIYYAQPPVIPSFKGQKLYLACSHVFTLSQCIFNTYHLQSGPQERVALFQYPRPNSQ